MPGATSAAVQSNKVCLPQGGTLGVYQLGRAIENPCAVYLTGEVVESFKEFIIKDVDQVVVLVSTQVVPDAAMLNEGRWTPSGKKDWMIRVDAADPKIRTQRHVHIAREKHVAAKNMQASWNEDKTRHDKGSFNTDVGSLNVVQSLAKDALGLPDGAVLEHVEDARAVLLESADQEEALTIVYLEMR